ncbi:MAG: SAM-dependent methyltransferase [Oscillospiraceae bacterium]
MIDVCSAPGGKAATVARYMQNKGEIICCDLQENRLSLIESLLKRVGITNAKVMQWDATVFNKAFENADAVLCDVPCSGIGIMAKKPDIRHKNVDDLSTLIDTQKAILKVSSQYVKVGGHLVYSTCTINKNENENVVNDFLISNKNFALKNIDILKKECAEMVTFLPQKEQSDGFFVAYLERLC